MCRYSNSKVFSGSRDYSVKLWDLTTSKCISEYSSPRNIVTSLCYSDKSDLLYQGSEDLCVRAWDPRTAIANVPVHNYGGYVYFPLCLALHRDEFILASGCKGFNSVGCGVVLWDIRNSSKPLHEFRGHSQDVTMCAFLPNHPDVLLTGSKDGSIMAWDCNSLSPLKSYSIGRKPLSSLCVIDSDLFAVAAMDGSISILKYSRAGYDMVYSTDGLDGEDA